MATLRNVSSGPYNVGNTPPVIVWTVVRGDTSSFKVTVTDDNNSPISLNAWSILMKIKRPSSPDDSGYVTDSAQVKLTLTPEQQGDDLEGQFTVSLTSAQSEILETGDIFDIELSTAQRAIVWTVAQGSMVIIEDVTD